MKEHVDAVAMGLQDREIRIRLREGERQGSSGKLKERSKKRERGGKQRTGDERRKPRIDRRSLRCKKEMEEG